MKSQLKIEQDAVRPNKRTIVVRTTTVLTIEDMIVQFCKQAVSIVMGVTALVSFSNSIVHFTLQGGQQNIVQ